jgi:hypothetical protein
MAFIDLQAAVRAAMQLEGQLYNAIRDAYEVEQRVEANGDDIDRHACGCIAAVNAIYNLGYGNGFKAGAEYERSGRAEQINREAEEAAREEHNE